MSFLRNHQIETLAKKATDYVITQLANYLKFSEQNAKEGAERETDNEALQVLFYIFIKKIIYRQDSHHKIVRFSH